MKTKLRHNMAKILKCDDCGSIIQVLAEDDGDACATDDLATGIAQHVYAEHAFCGFVHDNLADAFATLILCYKTS